MISAKRIVTIFRQKGGSGEYTKPADELTDKQLAILRGKLGEESPLIASVRSADEWFALTSSHLISKDVSGMCKIQLGNVEKIVGLVEDPRSFVEGKRHGGKLVVKLRDGSVVNVTAESGGPYVALMNVFLYLARMNGQPSNRPLIGPARPR